MPHTTVPEYLTMAREEPEELKDRLLHEIYGHLQEQIIPFWENMADREHGGYYGLLDTSLTLHPLADKGCIYTSRILWFFSRAYTVLKREDLLECATQAYTFLRDYCVDEQGGVFWSVTYDGKPADTTKHTYNIAFAIYALSEYFGATWNMEALRLADSLYQVVEDRCRDGENYREAMNRDFTPAGNEKLSENGVMATYTMNTLLHLLEAYTNLYRVTRAPVEWDSTQYVLSLRHILDTFAGKIWNPERNRQEVFFDGNWQSLIDLYSYGHDIETSWLMDVTLDLLNDPDYSRKIAPMTDAMVVQLTQEAYDGRSLPQECDRGKVNEWRVWWVQAETVLGYLNAYLKHPEVPEYLADAYATWTFIRDCIVDSRPGGEWYSQVIPSGIPDPKKPIAEPWKGPYHNGRMCLEVMRWLLRIVM